MIQSVKCRTKVTTARILSQSVIRLCAKFFSAPFLRARGLDEPHIEPVREIGIEG